MFIFGPTITKPVTIPARTIEVLDEDAYWKLDWQGNLDEDGGQFLYAKVAYPTIGDAHRQHTLEKRTRDRDREDSFKAVRKRGPNRRTRNKAAKP
jgi:hypothetical protein